MLLRRIARPLLATAFIAEGADALRNTGTRATNAAPLIDKAAGALPNDTAAKVPRDPATLVRAVAVTQIGGGVLLALGRAPRLASAALAATIIPQTLTTQAFWNEDDPARKAAQRTAFLKDISLLGGLLIAASDTAGKPSLGWRGRQAAHAAVAALPFAADDSDTSERARQAAHSAAEKGRDLAATAAEKGKELAAATREHGPEWAAAVRERGTELAHSARERGNELATGLKTRMAAS